MCLLEFEVIVPRKFTSFALSVNQRDERKIFNPVVATISFCVTDQRLCTIIKEWKESTGNLVSGTNQL